MTDVPQIRCRSYGELIEGLRRRKDALQMSFPVLDEKAGLCGGHADKILTGVRGFGSTTFFALLDGLGLSLVLVEDPAKMAALGEIARRDSVKVHPNNRIGKQQIERVRPVVMRALAESGGRARALVLTGKQRSEIARKAAKTRWSREAA